MQNSQLDTGESWQGFLDSGDLDILLQNTSLFEVKIYHQGEESTRKPDCTFLPSAIARMIMIRPCSQAAPPEAMVLLTSMTDINFGMRSSTKSRGCHRVPRSCTWNGISTTASLNRRLESVYSTTKFRPRMREMNSPRRSRSPVLDTTNTKYDPTNPRHPSRNEFLHRTAVESGSKRKADSLHNAKWLKTVSNGAVTRPHTPEDASKARRPY